MAGLERERKGQAASVATGARPAFAAATLAASLELSGMSASAQSAEADPALLEYGAFLATSCAPCHQIATSYRSGNFSGAARITGLEPTIFLAKLGAKEYAGDPVMRQVAEELGERERLALAAYLGRIEIE